MKIHPRPAAGDDSKLRALARRPARLLLSGMLAGAIGAGVATSAAAQTTLQVLSYHGLPGLHHSALSRFLAAQMAKAGLAEWHFAPPSSGAGIAADRVEWSFKLNPYAGGDVRSFVHSAFAEDGFAERRPVTIEARLYLKGEYQTLVETQVAVRGDPDDSDLIAAVLTATRNLLGPQGAYHAIDLGQYRGSPVK